MTYILAIGSTGYLAYGLPYLLMYPEFKCPGMETGSKEYYEKCNPEHFCEDAEIDWVINYESEHTLNNWMMNWDLVCESSYLINGVGMSFFACYVFGSFFLPTMSDRMGRRSIFLVV